MCWSCEIETPRRDLSCRLRDQAGYEGELSPAVDKRIAAGNRSCWLLAANAFECPQRLLGLPLRRLYRSRIRVVADAIESTIKVFGEPIVPSQIGITPLWEADLAIAFEAG